jgi:hypothetical protein
MKEPFQAVACVGRNDVGINEAHPLEHFAAQYARNGVMIVSGNNPGSDQAFVTGANRVNPRLVELYLPWDNFEPESIVHGNLVWTADAGKAEHIELAREATSGVEDWNSLNAGLKRVRIRNAMIVLRYQVQVSLIVANPNCAVEHWGNTGHILRIAALLDIPCYLINKQRYWDLKSGQPKLDY